ncbi:hypothetical protein JKP88DRAFT_243516 [Tribonema minus]|uniref:TRP C-terminal domain-containing protein n=1 Tax=Tribonema minus TaxID=303371 RepID=A0A836CJ54_9STRA|nr:hypothetical protein JKP88DRAFT_243516 [Tribonema minus]
MVFGKALLGGLLLAVCLGKVRADAIGHSSRSTAANNTTACPVLTYEDSSGQCAACPDGATCITAGQTIDTLSLEAGYWRGGPTLDIQECPRMDSCRSCSRGGRAYTIIVIVVFCAALAAVLLLLYKGLARDVQAGDATLSVTQSDSFGGAHSASAVARAVAWLKQRSATLMVRFKILVTHFQIVAGLPALLRVNFPQSFTALTNTLNVFNLDFWGLLSSGCFFEVNFLNKLLFSTLLPLAIIAAIFGVHGARCVLARGRGSGSGGSALWRHGSWDASLQAALLTLFMFYVVASTTVLQTFDCDTVQLSSATGETASYLRADYSVDCDSAAYRRSRVYAIIMTAVYPIGVPFLYASLLLLSRQRLDPVRADAKRSMEVRDADAGVRKTRFLWGSYRPRAFWYEVWLTLYKLLLSGLLVYFRQGTPTQTTVALLLTLVAMWLQTLVAPFTRRDENRLAECAYWATILTLIAALLISASDTGSDGVNMALLGAILSIINLLVIVLAVVQLFWSASAWLYDLIGRDDADEKPNSNINAADHAKPADAATKQQRPAASGSGSSSTDAQDCLEQAMPAADSAPMSTSPRRRARPPARRECRRRRRCRRRRAGAPRTAAAAAAAASSSDGGAARDAIRCSTCAGGRECGPSGRSCVSSGISCSGIFRGSGGPARSAGSCGGGPCGCRRSFGSTARKANAHRRSSYVSGTPRSRGAACGCDTGNFSGGPARRCGSDQRSCSGSWHTCCSISSSAGGGASSRSASGYGDCGHALDGRPGGGAGAAASSARRRRAARRCVRSGSGCGGGARARADGHARHDDAGRARAGDHARRGAGARRAHAPAGALRAVRRRRVRAAAERCGPAAGVRRDNAHARGGGGGGSSGGGASAASTVFR